MYTNTQEGIHIKRTRIVIGFTIVEMLIAIVVIGILAAIVVVSYNGVRQRSRDARTQSDISSMQRLIEVYFAQNGNYPQTTSNPHANWHAADVLTDVNCSNGPSQTTWIPGITTALPQSDPAVTPAVNGVKGCYLYVSDGHDYVISAWNMVSTPQSTTLYRRVGFRQFQSNSSTLFYTCNDHVVGGVSGNSYDIAEDYYKHSYTISNITDCDETPPSGA